MIGAALGYADRGFAVLPLAPRAKRPLTAHGKDDATTDRATVEAWWRQSPRANVGIACRASGFVALDVDHIPRGAMPEILRALAAAAEKVTTATDDDATTRRSDGSVTSYGKWSSSADSMFPLELIRRQSIDVELPDLASLTGPAALLGGVDWGATTDRSAVMAIARIPIARWNASVEPTYPMFLAWPLRHFAPGTQLSKCVDEIVACEAPWHSLTVETVGLGQMPAQEVARRIRDRAGARQASASGDWAWLGIPDPQVTPVHTSADHKTAAYGTLRALLERGQPLLADDADLLRELASLRVEMRANGVSLNAAGGAHDDLADALALAALPYRATTDRFAIASTTR